jgi:hypothetical protein
MQSVPITLWVRIQLRRSVFDIILCDKVYQWLATGRCFFPGTPVSSTNKTDRYDITEILLKVALNAITLTLTPNPSNKILFCEEQYLTPPSRWLTSAMSSVSFPLFIFKLTVKVSRQQLSTVSSVTRRRLNNLWAYRLICSLKPGPERTSVNIPAK